MFINHKVQGNTVILYLQPDLVEFATELGENHEQEQRSLTESAKDYISKHIPNVAAATVKVVLGTIIVATIPFALGTDNAEAAETTTPVESTIDTYSVQPGDSLWKIATAHNMTITELKMLNNLTDDVVYAGQVLNISTETLKSTPLHSSELTSYKVTSGDTLSSIAVKYNMSVNELKILNNLSTDMIYVDQTLKVKSVPLTQSVYSVAAGDTLFTIATKFNTTIDQIQKANNLTTDMIYVGQLIKIPTQSEVPSTYTVKSGDTLSKIASSYGLTIDDLKQQNNLNSDFIYVGQKLTVNKGHDQVQTSSYTVKSGDTLYLIAKANKVTVDHLKNLNNLTSDTLYVGQTLKIKAEVNEEKPLEDNEWNLTVGSTGIEVIELQNELKQLGYLEEGVTETYDLKTATAVKSFQTDYGIPVNGNVDSNTREEIKHAVVKHELIKKAPNYTGVPYVWGGETPSGFDCSGYVYYMFQQVGVDIGRQTSSTLFEQGKAISKTQLQPGDLVFYGISESDPTQVTHVGFYMGNNNFISATSSKGIWTYSMDNSYWSQYYLGAKRVY